MSSNLILDCNSTRDEDGLHRLYADLASLESQPGKSPTWSYGFPLEWKGQVIPGPCWVAARAPETDEPAGIAWLFQATVKRGHLGVAFHPDFFGQGLRQALVGKGSNAAGEIELSDLAVHIPEDDRPSMDFFENMGFSTRLEACELQAPEGCAIPDPEFPDGYFLRRFSEFRHLPTMAALMNRSYFDTHLNPGNEPKIVTDELLASLMERYPDIYSPDRILLLLNTYGKAVAYVQIGPNSTICAPQVVPEERQKNLHLSLVLVAMANLREQGHQEFQLFVEGETIDQADGYRGLGFSCKRQFTVMEKNL